MRSLFFCLALLLGCSDSRDGPVESDAGTSNNGAQDTGNNIVPDTGSNAGDAITVVFGGNLTTADGVCQKYDTQRATILDLHGALESAFGAGDTGTYTGTCSP